MLHASVTYAQNPSACTALGSIDFSSLNVIVLSVTHHDIQETVDTLGTCAISAVTGTALCRVQFVVNTSSISAITAEAWLPDNWNKRFLALGNGGLNGCIDYDNLNYGTSFGLASADSNNGHDGDSGEAFANNTEVLADFTSRSIHTETIVGKQLVAAYYGRAQHHSYYMGRSAGGRQGVYAALHDPGDFDGILAGAPAANGNRLLGWSGMLTRFVGTPEGNTSASFIPADLWTVISAEIPRQCNTLDGVTDGIITEPDNCAFHPGTLLCGSSSNGTSCLTKTQVKALRSIYSPLIGRKGELLYSRFDPGAESGLLAVPLMFSGQPFLYTLFGLDDIERMDALDPGKISTFSGDFRAFRDRGGRLITYHGRSDPLIASGNSKWLYNFTARTLKTSRLDDFYRLFLIPGMDHCAGGPGSVLFGQARLSLPGGANTVGSPNASNIFLDLVDWVENRQVPDTVVGVSQDGATFRRHCRYSRRSIWNGTEWICSTN